MQNIPPQQPPMQPPEQPPMQPPEQPPSQAQPGFQPPPMQQPGVQQPDVQPAAPQPMQQPPSGTHWFAFSQVRGFPLVNISSGEKIGEVGDVLLDTHRRVAQAFVTKVGFVHLRGPTYIPLENANIGRDAITFQPKAVTERDVEQMKSLPKVSELLGARVLSNIGELIGAVADAHFDQNDGTLLAFEIKPEGAALRQRMLGSQNITLPVSGVVSFGPNLIVDANAIAGL